MTVRESSQVERVPDLRSQLYDRLRERIRSGRFSHDDRLIETNVANDFGVSRTPAREALAMLARDGLLVQDGRGFSLPKYTRRDIFDVFELRLCLEPQAMRLIAQNITARQVKTARSLHDNEFARDVAPADYARILQDARSTLFGMVRNELLLKAIQLYQDHVHYVAERTLVHGNWQGVSRERMRIVLQSLVAGDGDAAAAAMSDVLTAARDAIVATLAKGER